MTGRPKDEAAWIRFIAKMWADHGQPVDFSNDAFVLPRARYAVTTDYLAEGEDFQRAWAPGEAWGYKALAVNLSDLAAMGASPGYFLLTLAIPADMEDALVERVLKGMAALSSRAGIALCGGDMSRSPAGLSISITALGEQLFSPLTRSGGRPGDGLFVSGPLGGARAALLQYEKGARLDHFDPAKAPADKYQALLDRLFRPPLQNELGEWLSKSGACSACMDLSDGLSRDLPRLCEASCCGAILEPERLPVDPLVDCSAREDALDLMLTGGEEQVLLFSVPPEREALLGGMPETCYRVGILDGQHGVRVRTGEGEKLLEVEGFDHFKT